jgi:hypothetical protein
MEEQRFTFPLDISGDSAFVSLRVHIQKFHFWVERSGVEVHHKSNKLIERGEGVAAEAANSLVREEDFEGTHVVDKKLLDS